MPGIVASSAEVSRNFGEWQDRAMTTPVRVTHHGRPRAVLLSIEAYEALRAGGGISPGTSSSQELVHALNALLSGLADGFLALDNSLHITAANAVAEAFFGRAQIQMLGQAFTALDPENPAVDVFIDRFRWVLRTGEPIRFQARTELGAAGPRTLAVSAFPYRGGVGVLLANVTQLEVLKAALADIQAEHEAMRTQGGIAVASLSPLGFFLRANDSACAQLGFDETRLREVRLVDLVRAASRPQLLEGMNRVVARQAPSFAIDVEFLCREGRIQPAHLSAAPTLRDGNCVALTIVWQVRAEA